MLALTVCLGGVFAILVAEEILYKKKILKGEYLRKFVHISAGSFIAFWPWLISWQAIQIISLAMLAVVVLNHRFKAIHMSGNVARRTYGGALLPVGVLATSLLTQQKIFFAIAILLMALADGLAAVIGLTRGRRYEYKVFGQVKSVIGSMTFWFVSLCILGAGLLFAYELISFKQYVLLMVTLPPTLAILENLAVFGLDNLAVPVAAVVILELARLA